MSTKKRKVHYYNPTGSYCGVRHSHIVRRTTFHISFVTCRTCLKILLSKRRKDFQEAQKALAEICVRGSCE